MAILAPHQAGPGQNGAAVGVGVAILAGLELGLFSLLGMTLGALQTLVPAEQRITGPGMIKRPALDQQPSLGGMALTAIGAQCPGVGILVAIGTGGMDQA
jgi:hypothetical protein